nr:hypothetical protein [Photobacterium leiognathi]
MLPKGFRRVRDYGLLRGHEKKLLQAIQFMFMLTGQLTLDNKDNARLLFVITLHDISNIYLYKEAWACPTLRIGVGFATHILIC